MARTDDTIRNQSDRLWDDFTLAYRSPGFSQNILERVTSAFEAMEPLRAAAVAALMMLKMGNGDEAEQFMRYLFVENRP